MSKNEEKSGEQDVQESAAASAQRRPEVDTDNVSESAARLARKAMPGNDDDREDDSEKADRDG